MKLATPTPKVLRRLAIDLTPEDIKLIDILAFNDDRSRAVMLRLLIGRALVSERIKLEAQA